MNVNLQHSFSGYSIFITNKWSNVIVIGAVTATTDLKEYILETRITRIVYGTRKNLECYVP